MKLETFFEKFELFADAPNAVGKMRELVLQLAVTGQLVEQKMADGFAADLLQNARAERNTLVAARKIKARKPAPVESDEQPFDIPASWQWARLSDVGFELGQKVPDSRFTYIDVGAIDADKGRISERVDTLEPNEAPSRARKLVAQGTVIYSTVRPYLLNIAIVEHDFEHEPIASTAFGILHPFSGINNRFLFYWLRSTPFTTYVQAGMKGMAYPAINDEKFYSGYIPVPPSAEQKRIVAKVDELMALCDRLEAQQQERDTRHAALARASLTRFAEAPTPANLDFLFHESYPITPADIRKALLSLAVQGKLVAQEADDEQAEVCLSRLGLKCTLDPVDGAEQSDDSLPPSWSRVRFEDVAIVAGGVTLGRKLGARKTVSLPYLRVANVKRGEIDLSVVKEVSIAEDEIERYALRENDLLMTEGGDWDKVGRAAIWKAQIPLCLHQNHVFRARMRSTEIEPVWFERYFNSPDGRRYFESASKQTTNLASINMRQVRGCPVPFPPLAEQRRIVAKVDQLMAMVDRLEAQLAEAKTRSTALLDAVIHELLNPSAEIVDLAAYRAAMACYAIRKMAAKPYFGRTAAAKVLYLAQAHVGLELGLKPLRDAAGPLDPWIYDFEKDGAREDWFRFSESTTTSGKKKITYQPGRMIAEQSALAERLLSARQRNEFDRLLALFADRTTEEAEIIATLFAAWNDFLIDGHSPGDEQIVIEVREHWHEKKARFSPALLKQWLGWLRQNDLVPTGHLPHTAHQAQLVLN